MNKQNELRTAYQPPETHSTKLYPMAMMATSTNDWNNAQIEDEFVEMYDL